MSASDPSERLSDADGVVLAQVVAEAAAVELPLAEALRTAADDSSSDRLAASLRRIADQLEQGRSVADVFRQPQHHVSRYLCRLVQAADAGGDPAAALAEWLDTQQAVQRTWRSVAAALVYPSVLMLLALLLVVGANFMVLEPMLAMFEDMELSLPQVTQMLVWFHRHGLPALLIGSIGVAAVLGVFRLVGGAARWRRFLESLPILGMLWHWTSVMELARLLKVLLERQVKLPEALELTAEGVHSPYMRQLALRLAEMVRGGSSLGDVLESTYRLPATLTPIVRWGERTGRLDDAFAVAAEMFEERATLRAELIASLLPPLIFAFLAFAIPLFVLGLYAPVLSMIQGLS